MLKSRTALIKTTQYEAVSSFFMAVLYLESASRQQEPSGAGVLV